MGPIRDQHRIASTAHFRNVLSIGGCSGCIRIVFIYMLSLLLRQELTFVQTGLKFLGSGAPLASASGMARNERCVQKVLVMCCKSQGIIPVYFVLRQALQLRLTLHLLSRGG